MIYLIVLTLVIPILGLFYLKSNSQRILYFMFFFFWFFGIFRILISKIFNIPDKDLMLLESLILNIDIYDFDFLKLIYILIISNIGIIFFIKKISNLFNGNDNFKYNEIKYLNVFSLIIICISLYIIKDELFYIVLNNISGYDVINNFGNNGGNYSLHVFLNRFALLILLIDIIQSEKFKKRNIILIIIFVGIFSIIGQRNEIVHFIIALFLYLSTKIKQNIFTFKNIVFLFFGGFSLRIIELYRSGKYIGMYSDLFVDSAKTVLYPIIGAETIVPFYSIYATIALHGKSFFLNFPLWIIQSFNLINFNLPNTYTIYKAELFSNLERGMAINILGSLNIYTHWFFTPLILFVILYLLYRILSILNLNNNSLKILPSKWFKGVIYFSLPAIILLSRNGIEGLRPLLFHNIFLYPLLLYLLYFFISKFKIKF